MSGNLLKAISKTTHRFTSRAEGWLNIPLIITLITIFQVFMDFSPIVPERISKLVHNPAFRSASVFLVAYSVTQDIESTVYSSVIFLALLQLVRTPEERKRFPYMV